MDNYGSGKNIFWFLVDFTWNTTTVLRTKKKNKSFKVPFKCSVLQTPQVKYAFQHLIRLIHTSVTFTQSSPTLWPQVLYSLWNSPGQNTGVGSLSFLQGIFPTQGSNPGLLHCRQILYQLSYQGVPRILEWGAYPFTRGSSWPRNWTGVSWVACSFFTNWAVREALSNISMPSFRLYYLDTFHAIILLKLLL